MTKSIPLSRYQWRAQSPVPNNWADEMAEMVKAYIRGEPIFVGFDPVAEPKRIGSVGRLYISSECIQNLLYGSYNHFRYAQRETRPLLKPEESLIKPETFKMIILDGHVKWDGRSNKVNIGSAYSVNWLKGYDASKGTIWKWAKPDDPPAITPKDKLGRDITKGDFISYILYHFDNKYNAAGIYYGKVTKIENDGTVWAKNIKLSEKDKVAEKRIKDNSLIVIMTKDLMDKLMMARLSIL